MSNLKKNSSNDVIHDRSIVIDKYVYTKLTNN